MKIGKKGLSPVIATVLLIMLAIILAMIILIWVKSFMGEQVTKNLGGGDEPIDTFCEDIHFIADAYGGGSDFEISAQNNGNVPIYGLEVRKKGAFSEKSLGEAVFNDQTLLSGETKSAKLENANIAPGETVFLVPVLLGQAESGKKYYTCDAEFGEEVLVQ